MTKVFYYYLNKGDKKSAIRIKKAYYIQSLPHQKEIRRKRKLIEFFKKYERNSNNCCNLVS